MTISLDKFIDTKYEFVDYTGKPLIIENSPPKVEQKYTDINGEELRAGMSLNNEKIYYRVNDREIQRGRVNIKNLELKK